MSVLLEAVSVVWMTIDRMLCGMVRCAWDMLPEIIQIKKIISFFTPTNVIATYLDVPAYMITVIVFVACYVKIPQNDYS